MSGTENSKGAQLLTPAPAPTQPMIELCITSQDGDKVYYRTRSDKRIKSLLMAYCKKKNIDYDALVFLHDGLRIDAAKTPDEQGIENEDEINAFYHQIGGVVSRVE